MKNWVKYILLLVLVSLLVLIRAYESELFYDPLIEYFKNNYLYSEMPEVDTWRLMTGILFRYALNSLVSLAIIYVAFQNIRHVKFTGFFMMVSFLILMFVFVYLLRGKFEEGYLFPFYIRRFLIHPMFLLILFPSFYFLKLRRRQYLK